MSRPSAHLGVGQGAALFMGAVLGPGVLALPHLAAAAAGPASILAWAGLIAASVPVALTFARLGAVHPDGGGIATYAAHAFGRRASAVVGWWFYFAVPIGVLAAALISAEYVAAALGLGRAGLLAVAALLLAAAFAANYTGLRLSGTVQLALAALLAVLLVAVIVVAAPEARAAGFTPFAPYGLPGVAAAAGVLFFAFVGWEAGTHLSGEFADARRDMPRATVIALAAVSVLYLGLAVTTIGVLGDTTATTTVPLTALLEIGMGEAAPPVAAVAALLLSFGAINAYLAGASRLGAALARDGALPHGLARGGAAGRTPRRSLTALAAMTCLTTVATVVLDLQLDPLMRATAACLAAVTLVGTLAAGRLLSYARRRRAVVAAVLMIVVVLSTGPYVLVPIILGLAAVLFGHISRKPSGKGHPSMTAEG